MTSKLGPQGAPTSIPDPVFPIPMDAPNIGGAERDVLGTMHEDRITNKRIWHPRWVGVTSTNEGLLYTEACRQAVLDWQILSAGTIYDVHASDYHREEQQLAQGTRYVVSMTLTEA